MNIPQTDPSGSSSLLASEIAVAVTVKQRSAARSEGDAAVALLEAARKLQEEQSAAAGARGGVDTIA